ncbi:SIR2 family protein [Bradyrhizobium sp. 144]|uniref:SIR2 family protein n=1 Tax=Bradyrhizobium sp. 144 TaxID=2782620 RepID=UPI001FF967D2|nr:SIR2 family protein [Bradyrhizobium sp. 144]MCK1695346.1 SIR2 family protein [Bradyrhizobium sp. 144]
MADRDTEDFLASYLKELNENNAAVFIGAGMSKAAGYVDWSGLMSPVAKGLGLDVAKESDLVALAQYHLNANNNNRHKLSQLLIDEFSDLKNPTENHSLLARLPIQTYWTTNYDRLVEKALEAGGRRVDSKYTVNQLATTRRGRDAVVYKMHGDIEHPTEAILSKDDYERYSLTHGPFITALSGDLVEKTFLFLGFSFTDPNLDFVLSRIIARFEKHQRQHFCVMKRRTRGKGESKTEFEYAETKQKLVTQDLMRFNIKTIFIDDYGDVTRLLADMDRRFRRRTVFMSGSASDYGAWGQAATEEFMSKLAAELINKNLRITSGFGLGIGSAVVKGAVQQIYSTSHRSIDEQLVLRPFPIGISDEAVRAQTYKRYRDELVAQAGIAIFVMGNKSVDGKIVSADGVRLEFEAAKAHGLHLIPIGSSAWVAEELWKEVTGKIGSYFPKDTSKISTLMRPLGKVVKNPNDLIAPIVKLIEHLTRG